MGIGCLCIYIVHYYIEYVRTVFMYSSYDSGSSLSILVVNLGTYPQCMCEFLCQLRLTRKYILLEKLL